MKALASAPNLVEQVRDVLLGEIASGQIAPGDRIIQEQIAQALLRNQGVLHDAPGRAVIEGLACRRGRD